MPGTPTPILGLTVPTVGGDSNTWGNELNGDLAILDNLGAAPNTSFTVNTNAAATVFPESVWRGTTGSSTITLTLPAPSAANLGKIFTVKKVDAGTGTLVVAGTIDGATNYSLYNQYQYVRVQSNGSSYDIIGNN